MSQTVLRTNSNSATNEVEVLKLNVYDLQKQLQMAYQRIGELVEERDKLRCHIIEKIKK